MGDLRGGLVGEAAAHGRRGAKGHEVGRQDRGALEHEHEALRDAQGVEPGHGERENRAASLAHEVGADKDDGDDGALQPDEGGVDLGQVRVPRQLERERRGGDEGHEQQDVTHHGDGAAQHARLEVLAVGEGIERAQQVLAGHGEREACQGYGFDKGERVVVDDEQAACAHLRKRDGDDDKDERPQDARRLEKGMQAAHALAQALKVEFGVHVTSATELMQPL